MAIEIKIPEKQIILDHEKLTVYQAAIEIVGAFNGPKSQLLNSLQYT